MVTLQRYAENGGEFPIAEWRQIDPDQLLDWDKLELLLNKDLKTGMHLVQESPSAEGEISMFALSGFEIFETRRETTGRYVIWRRGNFFDTEWISEAEASDYLSKLGLTLPRHGLIEHETGLSGEQVARRLYLLRMFGVALFFVAVVLAVRKRLQA